ncbi:hypothetical protein DPX16_7255 [Anabarilius grahami]|uniref:Transposase Tc1-like domain-containing protein n=1 Tax=Anabarilius grahami TaxID=495550 RepID=A0A3N0XMX9_ANAGA|nr:hypothetical protein DPX16_7255 [Anabarilius grahami]
MGLHSCRPVRVPMLTPVHRRKSQQWAREHQNWTMEQWKKVAWSDGRERVCCLPGEHMAPGCTMGRRQTGRGSVMLWAMFGWIERLSECGLDCVDEDHCVRDAVEGQSSCIVIHIHSYSTADGLYREFCLYVIVSE